MGFILRREDNWFYVGVHRKQWTMDPQQAYVYEDKRKADVQAAKLMRLRYAMVWVEHQNFNGEVIL